MGTSRLSDYVVLAADQLVRDVGRYLLFIGILAAAFIASLFGGVLLFGALLSPEASVVTTIRTGGTTAAALVESFSDRESLFVGSLWFTTLFVGMAALRVYQQTLASLEELRHWLRTTTSR